MFSLFDVLKDRRKDPFVLASDTSLVYRLRSSGIQKYDSASKVWVASTDSYDLNADLFENSDVGTYKITSEYIVLPNDEAALAGLSGLDLVNKLTDTGYRVLKDNVAAVKM